MIFSKCITSSSSTRCATLASKRSCRTLVAEAGQTLDPLFLIQPIPSADRVVVQQQNSRNRFAAHAVVQQNQRVRPPGQTVRRGPVPSQLNQLSTRFRCQEAAADHANGRI